MRHAPRDERGAARGAMNHSAIEAEADLAFEDEEKFLVSRLDVDGRTTTRRLRRYECEVNISGLLGGGDDLI